MRYENFVEWCIIICVVVGAIVSMAGLWCHCIPAFCIGLMVGGFMPIVVAGIWSSRI